MNWTVTLWIYAIGIFAMAAFFAYALRELESDESGFSARVDRLGISRAVLSLVVGIVWPLSLAALLWFKGRPE